MEERDPTVSTILYQLNKASKPGSVTPMLGPGESSSHNADMAPDVPNQVSEKAAKRSLFLDARIRATLADPTENPAESLIAEADAWAKTVQSLESPLTQKIRVKALSDWAAFLKYTQPHISEEDHWNRNVVEENWDRFLYVLVKTSTPRPGKTVIKARTLSAWSSLFLHCIVVYARDPGTKQKCGLNLLIKQGLYQKLKAQVVQLIHDFKLDRHYDRRIFYGRHELQIMQAHILDNSRHTGRQVAIQHLNRLNATFFFSCRASSLGPTHEKWRDLGYVPTCEDIRVFRKGYMEYQIEFKLRFHKVHIGTATGVDQTFLIEGVKYGHNVNFDFSITMLAHLFLRGVFQKKYETVKELVEDPSSELQIDPHFKDAPLFLEVAPGGREFTCPPKAAMSQSHYHRIQYWARESGLARAGATAFRRDTGNYYGLQMGERVAKDVLNHQVEGSFRNHYSRNMANYNFVQLRLGEIAGTNEAVAGQVLKNADDQHIFSSFAVECLTRMARQDPDDEQVAQAKRDAYKKKLKDTLPLKPREEARQAAWNVYLNCFNDTARGYQISTQNANLILKHATGEKTLKNPDSIPLVFKSPWDEGTAEPIRKAYLQAEQEFLKEQKKLLRRYDEDLKNKKSRELRGGVLTGSSEERQVIIDALDTAKNPAAHIKQAVADALGRAAAPANLNDPTSIRSWTSNLRKALETISVLEPEEDDDAIEGEGDRLFAFFDKMTLSQPAPEFQPPQPKNKGPDVVGNDGDDDDDKIVGGPDVCESDEMDIFAIPIQDMRRSFLEYLVDPVLVARAYAKLKASDEDVEAGAKPGYRCPRCTLYTHRDPVPENVLESISKLERHLLTNHSDWDDLELQIATLSPNGVQYHCPADYEHGESVQDVRRHALSGTCVNSNLYNAMAQLREELVPKHKNSRSFRNTRQGRSNVVNGVNYLEVEKEPEETPTLDLEHQVKGLVKAAVEFYDDDPEVMTVAQVLLNYVEDEAESLRPLQKSEKVPLSTDWETLGLDML